ncbi:hypothetical protein M5X06_12670 [Paenibacillus alvei]|uniref:Uncharacterized protein n=1 Tax=Paenibacillus alvei TaxID=44250 RepID=A0ABT4GUJ1_PAEAL|nr:hypothetical protein [Paenibacillus alvei]MCY9760373.1 hypothetical protein [Paenibacillus alvei]MCY9767665.1 hypothetical protein [Paenibacillus alvei]
MNIQSYIRMISREVSQVSDVVSEHISRYELDQISPDDDPADYLRSIGGVRLG